MVFSLLRLCLKAHAQQIGLATRYSVAAGYLYIRNVLPILRVKGNPQVSYHMLHAVGNMDLGHTAHCMVRQLPVEALVHLCMRTSLVSGTAESSTSLAGTPTNSRRNILCPRVLQFVYISQNSFGKCVSLIYQSLHLHVAQHNMGNDLGWPLSENSAALIYVLIMCRDRISFAR